MSHDEMMIELSSLALAINEQTEYGATYAFDGKRKIYEMLIYTNKSLASRVVIYYKKCKLEELSVIYEECKERLTKIIENYYYESK